MRITKKDLVEKNELINQELIRKGLKWRIAVSFRYDYVAIDLKKEGSELVYDTLVSGLRNSEAWYFLCGMSNTLYLLDKEN